MARNALIQVRRDTAANWTSVNPTLAAGEIGFETNTGKFKIGDGSSTWTALTYGADASKITGTTLASNVTGSSLTSVGTLGSLAVSGNVTIGGNYVSPYPSFHNKLINGDFSVNQRGVTSVTTSNQFGPDRWRLFYFAAIAGVNYFLETGPLLGFSELQACKGYNCLSSMAPSNLNYMYISQRIEDARTLAGQTVCLSFYATNFATVGVSLVQNFGTGGSPSAEVATSLGTVSTSPGTRSYVSATLPNVQSKTFGTNNNSYLELRIFFNAGSGSSFYAQSGNLGDLYNDVTITGVQLERGSVPTAYDKRPQQTELALCQRYYYSSGTVVNAYMSMHSNQFGEIISFAYPVTMRTTPTLTNSFTNNDNTVLANTYTTDKYNSIRVRPFNTGFEYGSFTYSFTVSAEL